MANRSSLTDDQRELFLQALRNGLERLKAAQFAKIEISLANSVMASDPAFAAEVERAEAEFQLRCLASIQKAAQPRDVVTVTKKRAKDGSVTEVIKSEPVIDWRAAAWLLDRRKK